MIKLYSYKNCGTCKRAIKWLDEHNISYDLIAIRQTPPSQEELMHMLKTYNNEIKFLFNTSGLDYRHQNLKEKRLSMSINEQLDLLSSNGNLIKRPFLISEKRNLVGFKQLDWDDLL